MQVLSMHNYSGPTWGTWPRAGSLPGRILRLSRLHTTQRVGVLREGSWRRPRYCSSAQKVGDSFAGQSEHLLTKSDLCNAVEDLSEDEKRAEIMPITLQQVYVLAKLGKTTEAQDLLKTINPAE